MTWFFPEEIYSHPQPYRHLKKINHFVVPLYIEKGLVSKLKEKYPNIPYGYERFSNDFELVFFMEYESFYDQYSIYEHMKNHVPQLFISPNQNHPFENIIARKYAGQHNYMFSASMSTQTHSFLQKVDQYYKDKKDCLQKERQLLQQKIQHFSKNIELLQKELDILHTKLNTKQTTFLFKIDKYGEFIP